MRYAPERAPGAAHRMRHLVLEYLAPLAAAFAATLVFLWPLPLYFTGALIGEYDVTWGLGTLWYWREALLGHEPLFYSTRLYYPVGIPFAASAAGPLSTLFTLPFWGLGPAAAYNAAVVCGFALTGYCAYLLARDVGCSRPAAWLAGLLCMMAPLHVAAVAGHVQKVFFGMIPLALLVTRRGMDPARSPLWALLIAPMLVLAFLQAPEQFVIAGIGCGLLALYMAARAARQPLATGSVQSRPLLRLLVAGATVALCAVGVVLLLTQGAAAAGVEIDPGGVPPYLQVDLFQFFIPPASSALFAGAFATWPPYLPPNVETAVYLSWGGLLLCLLAWLKDRQRVTIWLLLLLAAAVLALGPSLRVFGDSWLTEQGLPLPFAALQALPGMEAMRTPGRFMLLGYTAFAIAAALGLDVILRRAGRRSAFAAVGLAAVIVLAEAWPRPYPTLPIAPAPPFYQKIAEDPQVYGVFDLPVRPAQEVNYTTWHIFFSSLYQINQITHGKGIATGYVSRNYPTHPLFGHFISENFTRISPIQADMTVDGRPSSRYANLRYDLATNNYRYVVLHKPSAAQPFYPPGSWGEQAAERLIQDVFGAEPPLIDDAQMRVHEVGPAAPADSLQYSLALLEPGDLKGWWQYREAAPGTGLLVHAPVPIATTLGVKAQALYDPAQGRDSTTMYDYALLTVESGSGAVSATVPLRPGEEARVPVALSPGRQVITMTVTTSEGDPQPLMPLTMVINRVDLATDPAGEVLIPAPDAGHATAGPGIVAAYADGWYAPERGDGEGVPWRWASSPAALWVYSGESITATLRAIPVALHVPGAADGKGPAGELTIRVNGGREEAAAVTVGQPLAIPLRLEPGWNEVTLALAAGNFRPLDVQPDTGDGRQLSFALTGIDISP